MRLVIGRPAAWRLAAAALLLALGAPASAEIISGPQLGADETILEIESDGVARSRATSASMVANLRASAASQTGANAALDSQIAQVRAIAAKYGLAAAAIIVSVTTPVAVQDLAVAAPPSLMPPSPVVLPDGTRLEPMRNIGRSATATVEFRLSDASRASAMRSELQRSSSGFFSINEPQFVRGDPSRSRQAAKLDAIAKAQADSEVYANKLGLRVRRLVRVSERGTLDASDVVAIIESGPRLGRAGASDGLIETRVRVTVDFILGPR